MTQVTFNQLAERFSKSLLKDLPEDFRPTVHCAGLIGKDLARAVFRLWLVEGTEVKKDDRLPIDLLAQSLGDVVGCLNNIGKDYEDQVDREESVQ